MKVIKESWVEFEGKPTNLIKISDERTGFEVHVSDFGATLVRVKLPDKKGKIDDICFGQDSPEKFIEQGGYLGAVVGRVANRIEDAEFELDGNEYKLFVNNANKNSLHGGKVGFNAKMWEVVSISEDDNKIIVEFKYVSKDGEENYPGTLTVITKYIIEPMKLSWEFTATTDKMTIINMTNHAYWNLEGLSTLIDNHEIRVLSYAYMPGDEDNLVTGEVLLVENSPFDFRKRRNFSEIFSTTGDIDNNFMLNDYKVESKELHQAAELVSKEKGRTMKVFTNQPCIQIYTGNYMEGINSFGIDCRKHSAVCLETQKVPNAIKLPYFRDSVILKPNEKYMHKTKHEFIVEN